MLGVSFSEGKRARSNGAPLMFKVNTMAKFILTMRLDNAAFENREFEVSRLLELAAWRVKEHSQFEGLLSDFNGNRVGSFRIDEEEGS